MDTCQGAVTTDGIRCLKNGGPAARWADDGRLALNRGEKDLQKVAYTQQWVKFVDDDDNRDYSREPISIYILTHTSKIASRLISDFRK